MYVLCHFRRFRLAPAARWPVGLSTVKPLLTPPLSPPYKPLAQGHPESPFWTILVNILRDYVFM